MRLLAISLEHGNAPTSAWGYVGFGIYLLDAPGEAATSAAFGKVGIDLARRLRDPTTESWVLTTFAVQLNHWQAPLRSNVPVLRRAVQSALENGEFQIAGFAVAALVSHLFHSGAELAQVESEAAAGMRVLQKTGQQALLPLLRPYAAVVAALQIPRRERPAVAAVRSSLGGRSPRSVRRCSSDHPMTAGRSLHPARPARAGAAVPEQAPAVPVQRRAAQHGGRPLVHLLRGPGGGGPVRRGRRRGPADPAGDHGAEPAGPGGLGRTLPRELSPPGRPDRRRAGARRGPPGRGPWPVRPSDRGGPAPAVPARRGDGLRAGGSLPALGRACSRPPSVTCRTRGRPSPAGAPLPRSTRSTRSSRSWRRSRARTLRRRPPATRRAWPPWICTACSRPPRPWRQRWCSTGCWRS